MLRTGADTGDGRRATLTPPSKTNKKINTPKAEGGRLGRYQKQTGLPLLGYPAPVEEEKTKVKVP